MGSCCLVLGSFWIGWAAVPGFVSVRMVWDVTKSRRTPGKGPALAVSERSIQSLMGAKALHEGILTLLTGNASMK
jgi:hypothetical protein